MGRYPWMRRRSLTAEASGTADAVGCRVRAYRGRGARQLDGALVSSPCRSGSGDGNAAEPHAPTAAETGGAPAANACDTETNAGADMQASTAGQASASRRERVAAGRLSELAAEARAGQDATTLERLIVKGLTHYYHGIDNEARRALAAAEPPLNRHNTFIEPRNLDERGGERHVCRSRERGSSSCSTG